MTQGIYKLVNTINEQVYVGQSIDIEQRFKEHIGMLEGNKHHAYKLQEFYNKNKAKKGFKVTYGIVEEIDNGKYLNAREKYYIDFYDAHKNGFNSIGLDGSPTHTKQRAKINRKVEKLNKQEALYEELMDKYGNNLYMARKKYSNTFLYRVNAAIQYFVKNYSLDIYKAEVEQYRSYVDLKIIDNSFRVVQRYRYSTKYRCMCLHKFYYINTESRRNHDKWYELEENNRKSRRRYKWFMERFANLDEDILQHNTLTYVKTRYAIPMKTVRELIGYTGNDFKRHIIEDQEIKVLSKELNISYPHGKVELKWSDCH